MIRFKLFVALVLVGPSLRAATLSDCYQAALKRSETVASQTQLITQAEEQYRQAIGSVLPTLSGSASYLYQDPNGFPPNVGGFYPNPQPLVKATLTQPVFHGFREFAALKSADILTGAAREAKRQAEVQLLNDVAQSYFSILSLERDIKNLESELGLYKDRISDLQSRVRIGRSRLSEVLTVQSSQSGLKAQLESDYGQLHAGREMFAFLTGLPAETPLAPTPLPSSPEALEAYLTHAALRPDIKNAVLNLQAAKENVTIAQGAHLPSLDFTGNYYFWRRGFLQNVKWDLGLNLTVPIFNGGVITSQVHQAQSKEMQGELSVSLARRQAEEEVRADYRNVESDFRQIAQLTEAQTLAEKNFKEQRREYKLGLVTNLDVLTAMTSYVDAQRALDKQAYVLRLDMVKLEAAAQKSPLLKAR